MSDRSLSPLRHLGRGFLSSLPPLPSSSSSSQAACEAAPSGDSMGGARGEDSPGGQSQSGGRRVQPKNLTEDEKRGLIAVRAQNFLFHPLLPGQVRTETGAGFTFGEHTKADFQDALLRDDRQTRDREITMQRPSPTWTSPERHPLLLFGENLEAVQECLRKRVLRVPSAFRSKGPLVNDPRTEVISRIEKVELQVQDFRRLVPFGLSQPPQWDTSEDRITPELNDRLMNALFCLLQDRSDRVLSTVKCVFLTSFFFEAVSNEDSKRLERQFLKKKLDGIDFSDENVYSASSVRYVLFSMNVSTFKRSLKVGEKGNHWTLGYIDLRHRLFGYVDSMRPTRDPPESDRYDFKKSMKWFFDRFAAYKEEKERKKMGEGTNGTESEAQGNTELQPMSISVSVDD